MYQASRNLLQTHLMVQPPSKTAWWIVWIVLLWLEISNLLDMFLIEESVKRNEASIASNMQEGTHKLRANSWMLKLLRLIRQLNPAIWVSFAGSTTIVMLAAIVFICSILLLLVSLGFGISHVFGIQQKPISSLRSEKPNTYFKLCKYLAYFPEIVIILLAMATSRCIAGKYIQVSINTSAATQSFIQTDYMIGSAGTTEEIQIIRVSRLSDSLLYGGTSHIIASVMLMLSIPGLMFWMQLHHRVVSSLPTPSMLMSRINLSVYAYIAATVLITFVRMSISLQFDQTTSNIALWLNLETLISFGLTVTSLVWQLVSQSYLNDQLSLSLLRRNLVVVCFCVLLFDLLRPQQRVGGSTLMSVGLAVLAFMIMNKLATIWTRDRLLHLKQSFEAQLIEAAYAIQELEKGAPLDLRSMVHVKRILKWNKHAPTTLRSQATGLKENNNRTSLEDLGENVQGDASINLASPSFSKASLRIKSPRVTKQDLKLGKKAILGALDVYSAEENLKLKTHRFESIMNRGATTTQDRMQVDQSGILSPFRSIEKADALESPSQTSRAPSTDKSTLLPDITSMLKKIIELRLLQLSMTYTRKRNSSFPRLVNILISWMLASKTNNTKAVQVFNLLNQKIRSNDVSSNKDAEKVTVIAKQLIMLNFGSEKEKETFGQSEDSTTSQPLAEKTPDYGSLLNYLRTFKLVNIKIAEMLKLRERYSEELLSRGGADFLWAYNYGANFTELDMAISGGFAKLRMYYEGLYTPVNIVQYSYELHVHQDEIKASGKLVRTLKQKFTSNLGTLLSIKETSEIALVSASLEKNQFQRINLVSANIGKLLKFQVEDLVGRSILHMIPEPIKSVHHKLCGPGNKSGRLAHDKQWANLLAKNKSGYVRSIDAMVLFNYDIEQGLQGVVLMKSRHATCDENIVIVDQSGTVIEYDKEAALVFERGASLNKYSEELCLALAKALPMQRHILGNGVPVYQQLARDKILMNSYKHLVMLRQGRHFVIRLDDGGMVRFRTRLSTKYYPESELMVRALQFQIADSAEEEGTNGVDYTTVRYLDDLIPGELELLEFFECLELSAELPEPVTASSPVTKTRVVIIPEHSMVKALNTSNVESSKAGSNGSINIHARKTKLILSPPPNSDSKSIDSNDSQESSPRQRHKTSFSSMEQKEGFEAARIKIDYRMFVKRILMKKDKDGGTGLAGNSAVYLAGLFAVLLMMLHVLSSLKTSIDFAEARSDLLYELQGMDHLIWLEYYTVGFGDLTVYGRAYREGIIPVDFMRPFFADEDIQTAIELEKTVGIVSITSQLLLILDGIGNTSHAGNHELINVIMDRTISLNDSNLQMIGSGTVEDISFLEYTTFIDSMLQTYTYMSEGPMLPEEDAVREQLIDRLKANTHQQYVGYLTTLIARYTDHVKEVINEKISSMIVDVVVSMAVLAMVPVLMYSVGWYLRSTSASFYARYYYMRKSDIAANLFKLRSMDTFWDALLVDQWQVYKKSGKMFGIKSKSTDRSGAVLDFNYSVRQSESKDQASRDPNMNKRILKRQSPDAPESLSGAFNFDGNSKELKGPQNSRASNERVKYKHLRGSSTKVNYKFHFTVLMVVVPLAIVTIIQSTHLVSHAKLLKRFVDVYVNTMELYTASTNGMSILLNMGLNAKVDTFGGKTIEQFFNSSIDTLNNVVIPRFDELLEEDLGSFTDSFQLIIGGTTVCTINEIVGGDNETRYYVPEPSCGTGPTAFMDNPPRVMIRKFTVILSDLFTNLKSMDLADRHNIIQDGRWASIMRYQITDSVIGAVYYLLLLALSPALADLLKFDGPEPGLVLGSARDKLFFSLQIMLLAVGAVILLTAVVAPAERTLRIFRNTCLLLPWRLALQNPLLSHHFRR